MSGIQIGLALVMLAIVVGVAWWALKGSTPAAPKSTEDAVRRGREGILAGTLAPPIAGDPRRTAGGGCMPGWHGVLQWDLSSQCDADQWVRDLYAHGLGPASEAEYKFPDRYDAVGNVRIGAAAGSHVPSTFHQL